MTLSTTQTDALFALAHDGSALYPCGDSKKVRTDAGDFTIRTLETLVSKGLVDRVRVAGLDAYRVSNDGVRFVWPHAA